MPGIFAFREAPRTLLLRYWQGRRGTGVEARRRPGPPGQLNIYRTGNQKFIASGEGVATRKDPAALRYRPASLGGRQDHRSDLQARCPHVKKRRTGLSLGLVRQMQHA